VDVTDEDSFGTSHDLDSFPIDLFAEREKKTGLFYCFPHHPAPTTFQTASTPSLLTNSLALSEGLGLHGPH
jgi:hypothetical protein